MTARIPQRSRADRLWILGLSLIAAGLLLLVLFGGGTNWRSVAGMSLVVVGCVPIIRAAFVEMDLRWGVES